MFGRRLNTEWENCIRLFETGESANDLLMRRHINGCWQYRKPTDDEIYNRDSRWAW
jgi:hypothetical protein